MQHLNKYMDNVSREIDYSKKADVGQKIAVFLFFRMKFKHTGVFLPQ